MSDFALAVAWLLLLTAWVSSLTYSAYRRGNGETSKRLNETESLVRILRNEWNDTYEKLSRLASRLDRARGHDQKNHDARSYDVPSTWDKDNPPAAAPPSRASLLIPRK